MNAPANRGGASSAGGGSGSSVRFTNVAENAGIRYQWTAPGKRPLNILQTIGNGCAFLDYDSDSNLDILLVGPKLALYKGDGKGKFTDVTASSGLGKLSGYFLGCAVGDFDNDSRPDLYISGYREGRLLRNIGGATFRDVTKEAGMKPQPWGTSCAWTDVDSDGRLDLYVANYADFGPETDPQLCNQGGVMTSCGPRYYTPLPGVLYQNRGSGRFADITKPSGVTATTGRGLGVAVAHLGSETRPTLSIANDEIEGDLLRPVTSSGSGSKDTTPIRFTNDAKLLGTAFDRDGNVHGGMGTDWGDYDNDGRLDLFVATFQNEVKSLYHHEEDGTFVDMGFATGLGGATMPSVAFGAKFLDFDNDGWLDLAIANGHVQDNINEIDKAAQYRQASQVLRNTGVQPIRFEDISKTTGPDISRPIVGRGLATGDYDNDGRVDLLIVDSEGSPLLLHNETAATDSHWLGIRLQDARKGSDSYGATVTVETEGRKMVRQCRADGSYLSSSDPRVHFGLGKTARIEKLTVKWPSGRTDTFRDVPVDRYIHLREGAPAAF